MIEIVPVDEEDLPTLKDFSGREWPSADQEHFGDQKIDFTKHKFTFVARENDNIVGYISLTLDMGILDIKSLIVAKKYRGQGIAKSLVESAEQKGRSLGAHKVWLETGSDWRAKDFYEKLGYKVRVELRNHYANRDFVIMDKQL